MNGPLDTLLRLVLLNLEHHGGFQTPERIQQRVEPRLSVVIYQGVLDRLEVAGLVLKKGALYRLSEKGQKIDLKQVSYREPVQKFHPCFSRC